MWLLITQLRAGSNRFVLCRQKAEHSYSYDTFCFTSCPPLSVKHNWMAQVLICDSFLPFTTINHLMHNELCELKAFLSLWTHLVGWWNVTTNELTWWQSWHQTTLLAFSALKNNFDMGQPRADTGRILYLMQWRKWCIYPHHRNALIDQMSP